MRITAMTYCMCMALVGCEGTRSTPSAEPPSTVPLTAAGSDASGASAAPKSSSKDQGIDPAKVAAATGIKPEVSDGVAKVSYPRNDVKVEVDGWAMPPFMGLTSWAGFTPGHKPGVEAMVMGDLVLFEDEVSDVMSAALNVTEHRR
ncbi:DUF1259 domain-containing protein [Sorangium sp. So ce375]|uniref:DUF1259 domain-containing protein n=1 Tax=Sorangium sp. So ce375 TaxID=3133306 RepID=UPI003F5B5160